MSSFTIITRIKIMSTQENLISHVNPSDIVNPANDSTIYNLNN